VRRPTIIELERLCQKPEHRRIGNWMARRVARPAALRITWLIAPYGVSAHATTLLAWGVGLAAAAQLAIGTPSAWLCGAISLQLWYLLDHVDGQLARLHGTASLDGVQLDYLMHHSLNLLVPLGLGYGAAQAQGNDLWLGAGLVAGVAALLIGLIADARYKAFMQRLKRVRGELLVIGGGGAKPSPQPVVPRRAWPLARWIVQKLSEPHVVMNLVSGAACVIWLAEDTSLILGAALVVALAVGNSLTLAGRLIRSMSNDAAETEFAKWFRPAEGSELVFRDGWWGVEEKRRKEEKEQRSLLIDG